MNRVLDAFIGGWQLNGTYEWQSGEPFLLTGNNLYFPGDVSTITSRLGDGDGQGGKFGIDRSAIDAPGLVTLTSFGIRNVPTTLESLRNQPYSVANLGLTKNFKWGEGRQLQIRAEALNAFNHPYFGAGMGLNPGTAAAPNAAFGTRDDATQQPARYSVRREVRFLELRHKKAQEAQEMILV